MEMGKLGQIRYEKHEIPPENYIPWESAEYTTFAKTIRKELVKRHPHH